MGTCQSTHNILVLGMPGSGKTSLLDTLEDLAYHRKIVKTATPAPTMQFYRKRIIHGSHSLLLCELGGRHEMMESWSHYFENVHAIIFLLDSQKRNFGTEQPVYPNDAEMNKLIEALLYIEDGKRLLKDAPVVLMINKVDTHIADPRNKELSHNFKNWALKYYADAFTDHKETPNALQVAFTATVSGGGCLEPLDWLCEVFVSRAPFYIKAVQSVTG